MRFIGGLIMVLFCSAEVSAAIVSFDVQGRSGAGLLTGNENPSATNPGGSGGEIGAGISLDDVTNILSVNLGWGSGNGFTNLSGDASAMHIHQVTGGMDPMTSNGGVLLNLGTMPGFNASASNGGFNANVALSAANVAELMAGNLYFNVHTASNPGGEIRGNLVAVPEPSSVGLLGFAAMAGWLRRRRA